MDHDGRRPAFSHRLLAQLRVGSINDRRLALDELAEMDAAIAVPLLAKLLETPDFTLRKTAVMGLGNHRTDSSFQLLQQVMAQEQDANVLAEAADALYEFGDRALPELHEAFIAHDHWLVRRTILSVVVELGRDRWIWAVASIGADDQNQTVRAAAIAALKLLRSGALGSQAMTKLEGLG